MIEKHYRLTVTFDFGPETVLYAPDEIPEGYDPFDYCINGEYVHDLVQNALDDGDYDYDVTPLPALDKK